jgi:hypothetical protein
MRYDGKRRTFVGYQVEWTPKGTNKWRKAPGEASSYREAADFYVAELRSRYANRWYRVVPVVRGTDGVVRRDD